MNPEKTKVIDSGQSPRIKLQIVTATLGIVRMEWAVRRYGQVIPCNWMTSDLKVGLNTIIPVRYLVADAQNIGAQEAVNKGYEWVLFWEDDVIPPIDLFIKLNEYMRKADIPVVSGLYYTKSEPSEPILYRGRGNSYFDGWKRGDRVWVDGLPTGCLLVHCSLLKIMYQESPEYVALGKKVRKIFETPRKVWYDPETKQHQSGIGTSDLDWCDRAIKEKVLKRAGWPKIAKKKYPFLVDTRIFCNHIDLSSGRQYPSR